MALEKAPAYPRCSSAEMEEQRRSQVQASGWQRRQEELTHAAKAREARRLIEEQLAHELNILDLTEGLGLAELMRHSRYLRAATPSGKTLDANHEVIYCVGALDGVIVHVQRPPRQRDATQPQRTPLFVVQEEAAF